jgi:regulator of nucleoside diphosphate kinase
MVVTQFDLNRLRGLLSIFRERSAVNPRNLNALENELSRARTVASDAVPSDVITMNSTVVLRNLITGERLTRTLVFPDAIPHGPERVSVLSPLGLAMLGCRVGDVLEHCQLASFQPLLIDEIVYQPESKGNYFM